MNRTRKITALILALTIISSVMALSASATTVEDPVYEIIIGEENTSDNARAANAPSAYHNLANTYYQAELIDLYASTGSYTRYYFSTGTGCIYLKCHLERSGTTTNKYRRLEARLYEKDTALSAGSLKGVYTFPFLEAEQDFRGVFTNLDPNKFYYIRFYNGSADSVDADMNISGQIIIAQEYPD